MFFRSKKASQSFSFEQHEVVARAEMVGCQSLELVNTLTELGHPSQIVHPLISKAEMLIVSLHEAKNAKDHSDFLRYMRLACMGLSMTGIWLNVLINANAVTESEISDLTAEVNELKPALKGLLKQHQNNAQ